MKESLFLDFLFEVEENISLYNLEVSIIFELFTLLFMMTLFTFVFDLELGYFLMEDLTFLFFIFSVKDVLLLSFELFFTLILGLIVFIGDLSVILFILYIFNMMSIFGD